MYRSPRTSFRDVTTINNLQFAGIRTADNLNGTSKYAVCASLIGKNIFKGSLNWEMFTGMYSYIRPLSISVQCCLGTISSATSYVNQGLIWYDKKARTVTQFDDGQIATQDGVGVVYDGMLKNFGVKLLGSSNDSNPVTYAKFKIPFIQKMPIPEMNASEAWDQQFGALYLLLEGLFEAPSGSPPVSKPFGTVRVLVHSRFYLRGN